MLAIKFFNREMFKKFMEKVMIAVFVVLCLVVVCAEGEWGDINADAGDDEVLAAPDSSVNKTSQDVAIVEPVVVDKVNSESGSSGDADTFFTREFYYALAVVLVALIIVGLFVWLWIRGSRNKWD